MKYTSENKPIVCMETNSSCYKGTTIGRPVGVLWHSTGANNPWLSRYVQPSPEDPKYNTLINLIGKNRYGTDWNSTPVQAGLNYWIGKLADGSVATVQTLPWNYRPWGCGSGNKGSCNGDRNVTNSPFWIQFEICEDNLKSKQYFDAVYREAVELTAYLCKLYNLDPMGTVTYNGVKVPVILCHQDSYKLGLGSNHGDVYHWFKLYGKTMNDVRKDVYNLLHNFEEDDDMTQEKFNEMMNKWLAEQEAKEPGDWSKDARKWAEDNKIIMGDEKGRKMYKRYITREEAVALANRIYKLNK